MAFIPDPSIAENIPHFSTGRLVTTIQLTRSSSVNPTKGLADNRERIAFNQEMIMIG